MLRTKSCSFALFFHFLTVGCCSQDPHAETGHVDVRYPLFHSIFFPVVTPRALSVTLLANLVKPKALWMDAARLARARLSTCRSSRLKSKRRTRSWFLRRSAFKGKRGYWCFIPNASLTRRHTRLTADYNQLHASAVQNTQESRHVRASAASPSALVTRQQ